MKRFQMGLRLLLLLMALLAAVFAWLGVSAPLLGFAVATALFLVFTHRNNIRKMREGREYRFEKIMLRNWFR